MSRDKMSGENAMKNRRTETQTPKPVELPKEIMDVVKRVEANLREFNKMLKDLNKGNKDVHVFTDEQIKHIADGVGVHLYKVGYTKAAINLFFINELQEHIKSMRKALDPEVERVKLEKLLSNHQIDEAGYFTMLDQAKSRAQQFDAAIEVFNKLSEVLKPHIAALDARLKALRGANFADRNRAQGEKGLTDRLFLPEYGAAIENYSDITLLALRKLLKGEYTLLDRLLEQAAKGESIDIKAYGEASTSSYRHLNEENLIFTKLYSRIYDEKSGALRFDFAQVAQLNAAIAGKNLSKSGQALEIQAWTLKNGKTVLIDTKINPDRIAYLNSNGANSPEYEKLFSEAHVLDVHRAIAESGGWNSAFDPEQNYLPFVNRDGTQNELGARYGNSKLWLIAGYYMLESQSADLLKRSPTSIGQLYATGLYVGSELYRNITRSLSYATTSKQELTFMLDKADLQAKAYMRLIPGIFNKVGVAVNAAKTRTKEEINDNDFIVGLADNSFAPALQTAIIAALYKTVWDPVNEELRSPTAVAVMFGGVETKNNLETFNAVFDQIESAKQLNEKLVFTDVDRIVKGLEITIQPQSALIKGPPKHENAPVLNVDADTGRISLSYELYMDPSKFVTPLQGELTARILVKKPSGTQAISWPMPGRKTTNYLGLETLTNEVPSRNLTNRDNVPLYTLPYRQAYGATRVEVGLSTYGVPLLPYQYPPIEVPIDRRGQLPLSLNISRNIKQSTINSPLRVSSGLIQTYGGSKQSELRTILGSARAARDPIERNKHLFRAIRLAYENNHASVGGDAIGEWLKNNPGAEDTGLMANLPKEFFASDLARDLSLTEGAVVPVGIKRTYSPLKITYNFKKGAFSIIAGTAQTTLLYKTRPISYAQGAEVPTAANEEDFSHTLDPVPLGGVAFRFKSGKEIEFLATGDSEYIGRYLSDQTTGMNEVLFNIFSRMKDHRNYSLLEHFTELGKDAANIPRELSVIVGGDYDKGSIYAMMDLTTLAFDFSKPMEKFLKRVGVPDDGSRYTIELISRLKSEQTTEEGFKGIMLDELTKLRMTKRNYDQNEVSLALLYPAKATRMSPFRPYGAEIDFPLSYLTFNRLDLPGQVQIGYERAGKLNLWSFGLEIKFGSGAKKKK